MDWREAIAKERMIREVCHSLQLPLYGFSIWTVPYLLNLGLSLKQIVNFTHIANAVSHAEIRGERFDVDGEISTLLKHLDWCWSARSNVQQARMA